jgi:hypothetical protein
VDGGGVAEVRRTMKEMIKNRERAARNPTLNSDRPFREREWPSLKLVMAPLAEVQAKRTERTHESRSHGDKTRRDDEKGRTGGRERTRRSRDGRSRIDKATEKPGEEMMPAVSSLETPIHRSVIIERNRAYASYEADLAKRIHDFSQYIQALGSEGEAFQHHWKEISVSLLGATRIMVEPEVIVPVLSKK